MSLVIKLGDIHGNFHALKRNVDRLKIGNLEEVTYLIQVGDFGIGFYPKSDLNTLNDLNIFFKERNIICLVIRGNHDNPSFFDGSHDYSNLKLLADYTVMDLYDKKYLFVGGAISIDRKQRISYEKMGNGVQYWANETFYLDRYKIKDISGVDVLITHNSPSFCYPNNDNGFSDIVYEFADTDYNLLNDLIKERNDITELFDLLKQNNNITEHYYGHYHTSKSEKIANCIHRVLAINEFVE